MAVGALNDQLATFWGHGIAGIDGQVEHSCFQHGLICFDGPNFRRWNNGQIHHGCQCLLQHVLHRQQQIIHFQIAVMQRLLARIGQHAAREV